MSGIFGTDGIRDIVGIGCLKDSFLKKLGEVICHNIPVKSGSRRAIIGRDTRPSGIKIERIIARALTDCGVDVDSVGVISTPGLAYLTRFKKYGIGIMISASHNPSNYNGIKLFSSQGLKLGKLMEDRIERQIYSEPAKREKTCKKWGGDAGGKKDLVQDYIKNVVGLILGRQPKILPYSIKIAIDCANGALSGIAPEIFRMTGATVVAINAQARGRDINRHCGSLYPEALRDKVLAIRAHIGFSFDGDGDRVIMVDEKGHIRDGDVMLYVAARYFKSKGLLKKRTVVGTVMTNSGLENDLFHSGIRLVRTQVGDKYVLDEMLRGGFSLGGEPSGHIIFNGYSKNGDGIITALVMLKIMAGEHKTLYGLSSGLVHYPQIIINVPVRSKPPLESIPEIKMASESINKRLNRQGRLVLRYSGTEKLCRVMIEGTDYSLVKSLAGRLALTIRRKLG